MDWYNRYFGGIRELRDSTCGPVELVGMRGFKLGVLPINSATLRVGAECLRQIGRAEQAQAWEDTASSLDV